MKSYEEVRMKRMKRTEYKVTTLWSMERVEHRRVYEDEDGKRYIRTKNGYECIEENKRLLGTMTWWGL